MWRRRGHHLNVAAQVPQIQVPLIGPRRYASFLYWLQASRRGQPCTILRSTHACCSGILLSIHCSRCGDARKVPCEKVPHGTFPPPSFLRLLEPKMSDLCATPLLPIAFATLITRHLSQESFSFFVTSSLLVSRTWRGLPHYCISARVSSICVVSAAGAACMSYMSMHHSFTCAVTHCWQYPTPHGQRVARPCVVRHR